jgi:hypothetical protein
MTTTDTFVSAQARPNVARQAAKRPVVVIGVIVFLALLAVLVIGSRPQDITALSINNSNPSGARALAQILRDQGVEVRQVGPLGAARITDPANTTLVIANPAELSPFQTDSVLNYPGDVVFVDASADLMDALDPSLRYAQFPVRGTVGASCTDPDALVAAEVMLDGGAVTSTDDRGPERCFVNGDGDAAYVDLEVDGARRTVIASWPIVTNAELDELGHAALALRVTGRHENVVWHVASIYDTTGLTWSDGSGAGNGDFELEASPDFMPPGTGSALFALGGAALVFAFWRARRFGPLVTEPLPVVVRSSEATRGRARLYRRGKATGRVGAAMRGAAALRMGRRLGVSRAGTEGDIVDAIARASGRTTLEVRSLLYGPPPTNNNELLQLVEDLDNLESEVHRP